MSLAPPPPLAAGYRLDRYELLCPLADGGMAQVWVARLRGKHGFQKLVAIKTILPKFASDPQFQNMFLDEARIASGIQHANVAQIFDLGDEQGVLYIAMEWVEGEALTKLHRAAAKNGVTFPIGVLLRIVADTCGGLHAAHELRGKDGATLGVVHRDVSPHNILVDTQGVVKLIDFGIAKARDRSVGETGTGTLKGKVHYMAPEQALGNPVDRRADIWGIGAVLYHYLAGRPPFDGANQLATLHQLTQGVPPAPLPSTVPDVVAAIVMRALHHDPTKRFETALELQASMEAAMLSSGLVASTADVATFAQRHLAERAALRKAGIDAALAAAAEREQAHGPGGATVVRLRVPADNEPSVPPAAGTEATFGVASSLRRPRTLRQSQIIVALVGVLGVGMGIGATVIFRARAATPATPAIETVAPQVAPGGLAPLPLRASASGDEASAPPAPPSAAIPPSLHPPSPTPRAAAIRPPASPSAVKIPKVIDNGF